MKTFQRADVGKYGTLYEIIPKYDYRRDSHYQGCWKKKGKQKKKIEAQNVLPKNVYWPFKMNLAQYKVCRGSLQLKAIRGVKFPCSSFIGQSPVYIKPIHNWWIVFDIASELKEKILSRKEAF